jgi:apolipoprotein N-acyltransferase
MRVRPRRLAVLAAPFASGVLLWLASPPVGVGWLAWVALVPAALVALHAPESRWGRAALPLAYGVFLELLFVPALPFGLADDQWGDAVVPILVGGSPVLGVALLAIPLAVLLLFALRFPQPLPLGRPTTTWVALALVGIPAIAWTALDLARVKYDPGGFWGPLFLSQEDAAAAGLAALAGPWLVTFAVVAVNFAIAVALLASPRRVALAPAALVVVLAAALLIPNGEGAGRTLTVAAVQPGYDTAEFERPVLRYLRRQTRDLERASLDLAEDLEPLTREAAARGARLVVWPEATIWVDPAEPGRVQDALTAVARENDVVLVVPYFLRSESHGAAVLVDPEGLVTRAQPKQRPMWFLGENGRNRVPPEPVEVDGLRVGTLLGVDTQDPASARRLAAGDADVLVSSTHDWAALADEQLALARFHALGNRAPLVRADWRYGSAILGPDGTLLADAGLEKRRLVLVADVELAGEASVYRRAGDVFGWACALLLVPLAAAAWRLRSGGERAEAERAAHAPPEGELAAHPPP